MVSSFFSRILWLMLFSATLFMTYWVSLECYRAATSKHWPVTEGVVIAFYETPNYRYSASGSTYTNDHVSCNEFLNRSLAAKNSSKYAVRYPLQATVKVHYHPEKPELAVLETNFDYKALWAIPVLLFFTALCATGFAFGWRWRARVHFSL